MIFFISVKIILKWFNNCRKSSYSNLFGKILVKLLIIIQTKNHTSSPYILSLFLCHPTCTSKIESRHYKTSIGLLSFQVKNVKSRLFLNIPVVDDSQTSPVQYTYMYVRENPGQHCQLILRREVPVPYLHQFYYDSDTCNTLSLSYVNDLTSLTLITLIYLLMPFSVKPS